MKNIMLLFLSDLKLNKQYQVAYSKYKTLDDNESIMATHSNEPAVKYLLHSLNKQAQSLNKVYMLETKLIRQPIKNYERPINHVEYFKEQIQEYCQAENIINPQFEDIKLDEDKSEGDYLESMFEMVKEILKDVEQDNEIVAYVDITGGFRHATMLLIAIMRLLEYQNITTKQVLYSKYSNDGDCRIEDVTQLYKLYDLVGGVQEFKTFGSITSMKGYYASRKQSEEMQQLLKAMDDFSETIKLCDFKLLKKQGQQLKVAIEVFENNINTAKQDDKLLGLMLNQIKKEYKNIIKTNAKLPDYVKWCADRGLLQQAVTLYVEELPQYLIEEEIIYPIGYEDEQSKVSQLIVSIQDSRKYKTKKANIFIQNIWQIEEKMKQSGIEIRYKTKCSEEKKNRIINNYNKARKELRHKINHADNVSKEDIGEIATSIKKQIKRDMNSLERCNKLRGKI